MAVRGDFMSIVKFYRGDPKNAPKTTQRAHLGANAIITYGGKLLLEKRRDSDTWGLVGGGVKNYEEPIDAMAREVREELGIRIPKDKFRKIAVYGEPGRIAAYCDGSVWRMVIVVFALELEQEPQITISAESRDMKFFSKEELKDIEIVITHSDIVEDWFVNRET
jgi:8-oxo-dGTP pyrophosphatase MutT (NUDIX family)